MGLLDGLIGTFVGLHGMNKAAQAQKQLEGKQSGIIGNESSLSNWYNKQSNTDFLDTAAAKSGLANIREQYKQGLANANNQGVQAGATTEAKVAAKTGLQNSYNSTLSNLVGYGTQYQNAMKRRYEGTLGRLYGMNNALYQPKIQGYQNLAKTGFDTAAKGFAGMAGTGSLKKAGGGVNLTSLATLLA